MIPDSELNRLFHELERGDEASAPAFRELTGRAPISGRGRSRYRAGRLVAGLAAAAALAIAFVLVSRQRATPPPAKAVAEFSLARWSAPTDFLLETPGKAFLDSTPRIGLDAPELSVTRPPNETKGTGR